MPLFYANLDDALRQRMLAEIELDRTAGRLYLSAWLTPAGQTAFPALLQQAAAQHDAGWLASRLDIREGVDANLGLPASRLLAEGEFNRFYMRALCLRAIEEGRTLEVYRAKPPEIPRAGLEGFVGRAVEPEELLGRLREGGWSSPLLKPGAGLSVKIS